MTIRKVLYLSISTLFLLSSCAKQTSPTGGPTDTIPPILVKAYPKKQQTNFQDKRIELIFDEVIQLANPKEQIMIIPDVNKEYDITSNKKKVTLEFKNKLKDSTTYSVNFRDAVQDITEKNPAINLKIAFSTGAYIDSLSLAGNVYDLHKIKEIKEATIALYQSDTFNIFKHKPIYITKSDPKGRFLIENLKPGIYFIYAIDDKSRNLIVDSKNESYGFIADSILLKSNIKGLNIPLTHLDARPLKLTSLRPYNTYFNIKTSKNLSTYKISSTENITITSAFGEDPANIRIYNSMPGTDSTRVRLHAQDSIHNFIDTVFYVKFSKREVKPEAFSSIKQDLKIFTNSGKITGRFKFNKPVRKITYDSILYKVDSLKTIIFSAEDFKWDSLNNTLVIEKKFDKTILIKPKDLEKKPDPKPQQTEHQTDKTAPKKIISNQFYLGNGAFISIESDSSHRTEENIKPLNFEDTGILYAQITTTQTHILVQLLDKSFHVLQTKVNDKKPTFDDLPPGDYYIRLVVDTNHDGHWSPGNFFKHEEPEPIRYYKNEKGIALINLKANWEIDKLLIEY